MFKRFSYGFVIVLFALFFVSVTFYEKVDVTSTRSYASASHETVQSASSKVIEDSATPLGIKTEYFFTIDELCKTDNCLAFYMVHQYADVYFNDDLVYSLKPETGSFFGESITCNWAMIPLYQDDLGTEVRIVVTPVFEAVKERPVDFMIGSHYEIFIDCLLSELPEFIVSALCLILGICILSVHFVNRKQGYLDIFYLGMLSLCIGLWKLADLQITPMLLPDHTKGIGYIALGAVPLIAVTLLLYAKQVFVNAKTRLLDSITWFVLLYDIVVLTLHLTRISDLRISLNLTLIGLACTVFIVLWTTYTNRQYLNVSAHSKITKSFVIGLTIGLTIDLLMYLTSSGTANLVCSILIFFFYAIMIFFSHIMKLTRKVYTDSLTGLLNKQHWNESLAESLAAGNSTAIIILDLNSLKQTNDTYGHDAGDHLISSFANILKNTLPSNSMLCRWGGDEFAVMIQDISHERIAQLLEKISSCVRVYNQVEKEPEMSYSSGYAISSDFQEITADKLFKEADLKMYNMKKEWHREHKNKER